MFLCLEGLALPRVCSLDQTYWCWEWVFPLHLLKDQSSCVPAESKFPIFVPLNYTPVHIVIYSAHSCKEKLNEKAAKRQLGSICNSHFSDSQLRETETLVYIQSAFKPEDWLYWDTYVLVMKQSGVHPNSFNMRSGFDLFHEALLTYLLIILLPFQFSYCCYSRSQKNLWNDRSWDCPMKPSPCLFNLHMTSILNSSISWGTRSIYVTADVNLCMHMLVSCF